jgi:trehalose synthase
VTLRDVGIAGLDPGRFEAVLDPDDCRRFLDRLAKAAERLGGRRLWQVNSTEQGGGVAEMLHFLLGHLTGAGIDARWVVLQGNQEFLAVTKRVHHLLHGQPGDGGELDEPARASYRQTLKETLGELEQRVEPGDVVVLHDPQTAGLVPALKRQGAVVIWSCHVGVDQPNDLARTAWGVPAARCPGGGRLCLLPRRLLLGGLERARLALIGPCIDAFAPKNQALESPTVKAILRTAGILEDPAAKVGTPGFRGLDGSPGRVVRRAEMIQDQPIPPSAPLVVQVSHWDRLKDPLGCWRGSPVTSPMRRGASAAGGAGGRLGQRRPEGDQVLQQVRRAGAALPRAARDRVHLACLPMEDLEENAAMVNALQRRADVIVQESLAEGFALTVAEAMWKARPVLASRRAWSDCGGELERRFTKDQLLTTVTLYWVTGTIGSSFRIYRDWALGMQDRPETWRLPGPGWGAAEAAALRRADPGPHGGGVVPGALAAQFQRWRSTLLTWACSAGFPW